MTVPPDARFPGKIVQAGFFNEDWSDVVLASNSLQASDESGEKTPHDLLAICLRRIAERRSGDARLGGSRRRSPRSPMASLTGIPFGVKDIFETRGLRHRTTVRRSIEGRKGASTRTSSPACAAPAPCCSARRRPRRSPPSTPPRRAIRGCPATHRAAVPRAPRPPSPPAWSRSRWAARRWAACSAPHPSAASAASSPASDCSPSMAPWPSRRRSTRSASSPQTAADMKELCARGFGGRFDADLHRAAALRVPGAPCSPPWRTRSNVCAPRRHDRRDRSARWLGTVAHRRAHHQSVRGRSHPARPLTKSSASASAPNSPL